jgi:hypothetical protein
MTVLRRAWWLLILSACIQSPSPSYDPTGTQTTGTGTGAMCGPGTFVDPQGNGCDTDAALELVSASDSWACAKAGFLTGDSSLVNIEFFPSMSLADTNGVGFISTSTACLAAACPANSPVQFSWILGATADALAVTLALGPARRAQPDSQSASLPALRPLR